MTELALTLKDVAETLGVSRETAKRLVLRGELCGYKVGSQLRFTESDIADYIDRIKTTTLTTTKG